jgi:Zn-dependent oligopeptidase
VQAPCEKAVKDFNGAVDKVLKTESAKRTLENTLVAFETALAALSDQTNNLTVIGSISADPKLAGEATACATQRDQAVDVAFAKKELYDIISALKTSGDEKRLAEVLLARMEAAGATLPEAKDKLKQLADLEKNYESNLKGVTASDSASVASLADSEARKAAFIKVQTRGATENAKILPDLLRIRGEIASLKKKKSWSDFTASQGMPKDAVTVAKRLLDFQEILSRKLKEQKGILQKYASEHTDLKVADVGPWDIDFLSAKYFASDSADTKDAFDRDAVFAGILQAVSTSLGLKIAEVKDAKPIAEGVKHFSVAGDKGAIASFYVYLSAKNYVSNKSSGAGIDVLPLTTYHLAGGKALGPSALMIGNVPANLRLTDVGQLLRDTARLLQHLLYTGAYASLSSAAETADYREIPAKTLQNWASEPAVLALVSKIPADKAKSLAAARAFAQTYRLARHLYGARVDVELHGEASKGDLATLGARVYEEVYGTKLDLPSSPAISGLNGKLWVSLWSEAYGSDLYREFAGKPLDPVVGKRFRDSLLAKGAAGDPDKIIFEFLNRDPAPADGLDALLKR